MSKADVHQRAHLARLAGVQGRMQGMSHKALERHFVLCEALREEQEALYPDRWGSPNEHWQNTQQRTAWFDTPQGKAWLHWRYGVSGALEMPGHRMSIFCRNQAELFHRLAAATDGGGDALMAIGLDANCFAEAQGLRDRYAAPGSGGACHGRKRCGTPRPRPAGTEAARTASHRKVRSADTAARPDPCRI